MTSLLELRYLGKRFGMVQALKGISFTLDPGEVVALMGDNGSGKSTLLKTIAGVFQADQGEIRYRGEPVRFASPDAARQAGIETVYQDLALADNLDAAANIFLGREPKRRLLGLALLDQRRMRTESYRLLAQLGIEIPGIDRPVRQLSGGQRQAVAIARAIHWQARLLLMDEPTAALGILGRDKVIELIRTLTSAGTGILFIGHDLETVFTVADRIIVLRHGAIIAERTTVSADPTEIANLIKDA